MSAPELNKDFLSLLCAAFSLGPSHGGNMTVHKCVVRTGDQVEFMRVKCFKELLTAVR